MISVVIPLKSEFENPIVAKNLTTLERFKGVDVQLVVSADGMRAKRINDGIEKARFPMVLIIHPRSALDSAAIEWLIKNSQRTIWGGFTHRFDLDHPLLKFTSWYSNKIRGQRGGILYLDHCIFLHRDILQENRPVPEVEIFEDTQLSKKLRKKQMPIIVNYHSTTSAIRFRQNGVVYQSALNQLLKVAYHLGASDKLMNRIYEKGLNLN